MIDCILVWGNNTWLVNSAVFSDEFVCISNDDCGKMVVVLSFL